MVNTNIYGESVAALFHSEADAEGAIADLNAAGFSESEISVATASASGGESSVQHRGFWDRVAEVFGKDEHTEAAPQLEHSLERSGISPDRAQYLNSALSRGDVLVVVHAAGDRKKEAKAILEDAGADIDAAQGAISQQTGSDVTDERRIQLVGEVLRVHKERIKRGEVTLRKEVVTENQNIEVPVTREELVIERVPVRNRDAGTTEPGSGENEIRVPLSEERVRVEKKPVISEEIRVGKRPVERTEQVTDSVRHEELRTETEGTPGQGVETPKKRRTA